MTRKLTVEAVVSPSGELSLPASDRARLSPLAGKHVSVTVERYVKSKSNPQLRYYFGCIVPTWGAEAGYDEDEMDQELRKAYLPKVRTFAKLTGELVEELPSLASLTVEEMTVYLDRVIREAAQQGIRIPAPEERNDERN